MTEIEFIAAALGVCNIVLIIRRSIWNYPAGIAMVTLYGFVFLEVKLYSDALLQLFFLAANIYGWALWGRAQARSGDIVVERLTPRARLAWIGGAVLAGTGWGWLMQRFTDAALPYWDAMVAIPSIAAQLLMARRRLENWWLWIAVDAIAIPLYWHKGLMLTAALYAAFLLLAVAGLVEWRRVAARGTPPA